MFSIEPKKLVFLFFFSLWSVASSAQSSNPNPFYEKLFVAVSAENKQFGIRHFSLDNSQQIVIQASVFKDICTFKSSSLCEQFNSSKLSYSEDELKQMGISFSYDPTTVQLKLKLPSKWANEIKNEPNRTQDLEHSKFSREYLKFVHDHQKENDIYGKMIQSLLNFSSQGLRNAFASSTWTFPDSIVESSRKYAVVNNRSSSSLAMSSGMDEIVNRFSSNTQKQSAANSNLNLNGKPPLNSSQTNGSTLSLNEISKSASTNRNHQTTSPILNENKLSFKPEEPGKGIDANDAILQELKGMHRILEKMAEKGLSGENTTLDTVNSLIDTLSKQKNTEPQNEIELAKLSQLENEAYKEVRNLSREELFQQAFGRKPPPKPKNVSVQLYLENKKFEIINLHFDDEHKNYWFESQRLITYLDTLIIADSLSKIYNGVKFEKQKLLNANFEIELLEHEFKLFIDIPTNYKKIQKHNFIQSKNYLDIPSIEPAWISAYFNLSLLQDFSYRETFFSNDSINKLYSNLFDKEEIERLRAKVKVDGAINTLGWVFESNISIEEVNNQNEQSYNLSRGEARIVKDWRTIDLRLKAGDVSSSTSPMKIRGPSLLGLSLDKQNGRMNEELSKKSHSSQDVELKLDEPAKVKIFVNGNLYETLNLASGNHVFSGINGEIGENTLRLLIEYQNGQVFEKTTHFIQGSGKTIPKGDLEYTLSGGFPRVNTSSSNFKYLINPDSLSGGGIFRYGLLHYLTSEIHGFANQWAQGSGLGFIWSSDSINHYQFNLFQTSQYEKQIDYRAELIRSWSLPNFTFGLQGSYQSKRYLTDIFDFSFEKSVATQIRGFANIPLWTGNLSASFQADFNRKDSISTPIDYHTNTSYSISPLPGFSTSLSWSLAVSNGNYSPQFNASASYFFNVENHNFYAMDQLTRRRKYNTPSISSQTILDERGLKTDSIISKPGYYSNEWSNNITGGWAWSKAAGLNDGLQTNVQSSIYKDGESYRFGFFATENLGQLSANYSISNNSHSSIETRGHYISTRAEMSLSFADGLFAIGRPIYDNYVLVNTQKNLANTDLRLMPNEQYGTEYSRTMGPLSAVYSNLQDYRLNLINIKPVDLQLGASLKNSNYQILPEYKRGYALKIGVPTTVLLRARLLDAVGHPISRISFSIVEKSKPDQIIVESFANKHGVFQAGNLIPGKTYILKFTSDAFIKDIEIEIPDDENGIYNLDDITVENETLGKYGKLNPENTPEEP